MTSVSNSSSGLEEEINDGEELVSSTSAGLLCPGEVDSDGPMDTAETSAFLGRQDRAESAQRIDSPPQPSLVQSSAAEAEWFGGGPSTSSASVDLCPVEDDEGPMNIARISASLEQQDRAQKEEARGINSETSLSAVSPSRRESSVSSVQPSPAETNLRESAQELTAPPTNDSGLQGQYPARRAFNAESQGVETIPPSSIMAEAYTVTDSPVFTASIIEERIPW